MKKLPIYFVLTLLIGLISCGDKDNYWTQYEDWRIANEAWFIEQLDAKDEQGNAVYTQVIPSWDKGVYVLMKWYNDTTLNQDAQSPYETSTVDVIYKGTLYDGVAFDSSYNRTDSIFRTQPTDVIKGWTIALERMRVGDSCQVIIPQSLAYGATSPNSIILPYSTLVFDMKLKDIPGLEKPVN